MKKIPNEIKEENNKWFSEEEIRHIINMLSKEEETESVDWEFQLKYKLFGEL